MTENKSNPIPVVYHTRLCPDCIRALAQFKINKIEIKKIDINKDKNALEYVKQVNNGNASVPTIVFPNGDIVVEPSYLELSQYINRIQVNNL